MKRFLKRLRTRLLFWQQFLSTRKFYNVLLLVGIFKIFYDNFFKNKTRIKNMTKPKQTK